MSTKINKAKVYMVVMPLSLVILLISLPTQKVTAQIAVVEVIKAGVKKVIKAVDLKIQRLQNETIWLQNAQKVLENTLSKLKLTEIADWSTRQKDLYSKYFDELWRIKSAISYYHHIKEITQMQVAIVEEYNRAKSLFARDRNFSADELIYMEGIYSGILNASLKNLDQVLLVVNSFKTQMSDGSRLEMIDAAADKIEQNFTDLKQFNSQQMSLSLGRAKDAGDLSVIKKLYGIL